MTFATFCSEYIALITIFCALTGLAAGALLEWLWMRWRYREGIAMQRQFDRGLFRTGGK